MHVWIHGLIDQFFNFTIYYLVNDIIIFNLKNYKFFFDCDNIPNIFSIKFVKFKIEIKIEYSFYSKIFFSIRIINKSSDILN